MSNEANFPVLIATGKCQRVLNAEATAVESSPSRFSTPSTPTCDPQMNQARVETAEDSEYAGWGGLAGTCSGCVTLMVTTTHVTLTGRRFSLCWAAHARNPVRVS